LPPAGSADPELTGAAGAGHVRPQSESNPFMTTATPTHVPPRRRVASAPRARPGPDLALGAGPVAVVSTATCWLLGLPTSHLLEAAALYALLAGLVLLNLPGLSRGPGLGPANRVTLARGT